MDIGSWLSECPFVSSTRRRSRSRTDFFHGLQDIIITSLAWKNWSSHILGYPASLLSLMWWWSVNFGFRLWNSSSPKYQNPKIIWLISLMEDLQGNKWVERATLHLGVALSTWTVSNRGLKWDLRLNLWENCTL